MNMETSGSAREPASRFELIDRLGENDAGEVWAARDALGWPVTIQYLTKRYLSASGVTEGLWVGGRSADALPQHPNILRTTEVLSPSIGPGVVIMEPFTGIPLSTLLSDEGALELDRALAIAIQVATAVEAAHRARCPHGAVDADHVLVAPGSDRVVVHGFGLQSATSSHLEGAERRADVRALVALIGSILPPDGSSIEPSELVDRRRDLADVLSSAQTGDPPAASDIVSALRSLHYAARVEWPRETPAPLAPHRRSGRALAVPAGLSLAAGIALVATLLVSALLVVDPFSTQRAANERRAVERADDLVVPPLVASTVSRARTLLFDAGLELGEVEPTVGPPGVIVATRPSGGARVSPGTPVDLVVGVESDRLPEGGP